MQDTGLIEFESLVQPLLAEMGYGLVEVKRYALHGNAIVRVMIERGDEGQVTFADCKKASHGILDLLEEHDPIGGDYNLELSSAGLERPLVKLQDFARFKGEKAKLVVKKKMEDRRQLVGELRGVAGQSICLRLEDTSQELLVPLDNLQKAHLVVDTDAYDLTIVDEEREL